MTLDDLCPQCQQRTGLPRRVQTIPGRAKAVVVTMVCPFCGHQWQVEHDSIVGPDREP
jgi:C4-type Zn-finger protein